MTSELTIVNTIVRLAAERTLKLMEVQIAALRLLRHLDLSPHFGDQRVGRTVSAVNTLTLLENLKPRLGFRQRSVHTVAGANIG